MVEKVEKAACESADTVHQAADRAAIKPYLGQVVLFHDETGAHAALVIDVHADCVDLAVFGRGRDKLVSRAENVPYIVDETFVYRWTHRATVQR